ncbi:MAG TPA: hypothetical protein PLZ84_07905, partial [Clostridia bacterium]|nr:hypothetical protein [Clostridia bacterium]
HLSDEETGALDFTLTGFSTEYYTGPKEKIEIIRSQAQPFTVELPEVTAPVTKDQELGVITFKYDDEVITTATAIASRDVHAKYTTPQTLIPIPVKEPNHVTVLGWNFSKSFVYMFTLAFFSVALIILIQIQIMRRRRMVKRLRSKFVYRRKGLKF